MLLVAIVCQMVASSCSKQQDLLPAPAGQTETLAGGGGASLLSTTYTIDFEGIGSTYMAGPTSYADNAYSAYSGTQIAPYVHAGTNLRFAIKGAGSGPFEYWDGGFIVSNWNYKSNIPGKTGDWWYSYENQASVYSGTHGSNNGGYGGSSNFAVMFGYVDFGNELYATMPTLNFTSGSGVIDSMKLCLSSYTYGVIMNGNSFGNIGVATPLSSVASGNGYLKLLAYGYNGNTPTNSGNPVSIYLARYSGGSPVVAPLTTWTNFNLSALGTVTRVEFNIEGNDSGDYGLNTPAYVCMDNIVVTL